MDTKNNFQWIFLVTTVGTLIVTVYNYLSQEEHRSIQKEIDKLRLADMRAKKAAGVGISEPLPQKIAA